MIMELFAVLCVYVGGEDENSDGHKMVVHALSTVASLHKRKSPYSILIEVGTKGVLVGSI